MNLKIEQIETAETAIERFRAEEQELRSEALQDGIIDAREQADLDRIAAKIEELRNVARNLRATVEENRRRWDAQDAALKLWKEHLAEMHEAGQSGLAQLDRAANDITDAVEDQRWADASQCLATAQEAMAPIYEAFRAAVPVPAGAGDPGGPAPEVGAPVPPGYDQWISAQDALTRALAALERHAQAAHAAIAPEITAIKADRDAAVALADGGDFEAATTAMTPLIARCAATEDKAHDAAHYESILTHRTGLVNHPSSANTGIADVDDLQTEMAALLAGAQSDATSGDFAAAVVKLDQISPIFERKRALVDRESRYRGYVTDIDALILSIDGTSAADRAPVQAQIDRFKQEYTAAKYDKTKDYAASAARLSVLSGEFQTLDSIVQSASNYASWLTPFETQLTTFENHAGRAGIEEFYQAMKIDHAQALADAAASRFPTAIRLLSRTQPQWAAQQAIAVAYETYLTNRQTATAAIDAVRALPDTADVLQQADALMATAATQAAEGNIAGAEASLVEAQTRANDAKTASEALGALGDLRDDDALDAIAEDFDAALAVYTDMRANVVAQDTGNAFSALIADADAPVEVAKTEAAKPDPDMSVTRTNLDAGIAILEDILPKILAQARYQTHLATVKTLVETTLPGVNADNCITPAIDACKTLITEAEALASDPGFDFPAAEAKLNEASERGQKAQTNAASWVAIAADRTALTNSLATINGNAAGVVTLMANSVTRHNDLLKAIHDAVAAENFTDATSKAREVAGLVAVTPQDIGHCVDIDTNFGPWVTSRISQIQGGQPEVAAALAETTALQADYQAAINTGAYADAWRMTNDLFFSIKAGIDALAGSAAFTTQQTATRAKLDAIVAIRNAAVESDLTALEARYAEAGTAASAGNYTAASAEMTAIGAECDRLLPIAQTFGEFVDARNDAEAKLLEAEGHAQVDAIQTILTRLRGKFDNAEAIAIDGDPPRAKTMMEEVEAGSADAILNAMGSAVFEGIAEAIGDTASDSGPSFIHIAAAREAYDWQAGKANADVARTELDVADTQLKMADNDATPPADATAALRSAMDLVTEAGQIISQHTLLIEALAMARTRIGELRSHAQAAYLASQINGLDSEVNAIEAKATDLAALPQCSADLEAVMATIHDLRAKLDAHASYVALRSSAEVEPRLAVLEAHDHSYAIQTNIEAIRSKLAEAGRLCDAFDPIPALALLNEVKDIGLSALVLADMRANTPPSPADVQEILARPDGQAELDAMVDALEPDAQRAVLKVAFEARFGCTLQNFAGVNATDTPINPIAAGTQDGPNIRRFYEIMSDLPASDTLGNDSMRIFTEIESGQGSLYRGDTKDVVMREGDAALSAAYTFGAEYQVGEVDEGCEPANEEPVNFFSWNTLHEVGHAVDDQRGFMNSHQSGPAFGGWTEYGRRTDPIADVAASKFRFDRDYIRQLLGTDPSTPTNAVTPPAIPSTESCSPEEWEGRRVAFISWFNSVRSTRDPWASQSRAQQIAIGGIVYQESYPMQWTSYELSARSKGMTAYQFRAPGEWFSELYAAYHSGKIKDTHPAASWLADLAGPDA